LRGQFFKFWNRVRSGFWFIPAIMAGVAVASAFASVAVDERVTDWVALNFGWTFTGGAEGASAVMGVIAGSMITIAGVVFSMTLVALSLASSQLGPRLLRVFMRDSTTQVVLGTFIATFLYCLIVLRTIRRVEEVAFVPHLSVTFGVLLAVVSVGVLIYFIHHVSVSIQANVIAARIGKELIEGIDRLFPGQIGPKAPRIPTEPPDAAFIEVFDKEARPVGADADGYLQFIDAEALLALAMEEDLVVRLERKPGNYVVASRPMAMIWPGSRVTDKLTDRVNALFVLGQQRTSAQDIKFAVNQLVEIAVRALSPGLNDPFTAMTCVDHLGAALCRLAVRDMPSPYRLDRKNQLRVIAPAETFPEIIDAAFNRYLTNDRHALWKRTACSCGWRAPRHGYRQRNRICLRGY
jgi:uncharacterized membrane protein